MALGCQLKHIFYCWRGFLVDQQMAVLIRALLIAEGRDRVNK